MLLVGVVCRYEYHHFPCHLHTFLWKLRRINDSTFNLYKIQERSVIKNILELYMQNIWLYATIPE
jgi:hypothetical protein